MTDKHENLDKKLKQKAPIRNTIFTESSKTTVNNRIHWLQKQT